MAIVPKGFSGTAGGSWRMYVRGEKALVKKLSVYEKITRLKLYEVLKISLLSLEAESKRLITSGYYKPAVDTGRMRMSVTNEIVSFTPNKAEGKYGTNVDYAIYVHEGTDPHFPPLDAIQEWARLHNIPAFLVAKKLAEEGTKARPFATDALENKRAKITLAFKKALKSDLGASI